MVAQPLPNFLRSKPLTAMFGVTMSLESAILVFVGPGGLGGRPPAVAARIASHAAISRTAHTSRIRKARRCNSAPPGRLSARRSHHLLLRTCDGFGRPARKVV